MSHSSGRIRTAGAWLAVATACVFALGGCGKKDDAASPLTDESGLLRYVPADTPYVFAALAPLPKDLSDKIRPKVDEILGAYHTIIEATLTDAAADREEETGEAPPAGLVPVVRELESLLTIAGLENAGITRESTSVFYGNGLLPVLRLTLRDAESFEAAMARIEEKAGTKLPTAEIDGNAYRYVDDDKLRVIIATIDNQLVVTLTPSTFDDAQLGRLLGLTLPDTNIAESGELRDVATEYGYLDEWVGFVSTERLAGTFVDEQAGLNAELLAMAEYDTAGLSETCRSEIRSIAAVAPRVVIGYHEMSVDRLDSGMVVELREDIASGLMTIPSAVPGLGTLSGGFLAFGMSADVQALRDFYEARLEAIEAEPYRCELLAGLQAQAEAGRRALNAPVPPIVYGVKGFMAVINDIDGIDFENRTPPESVDASFVLALDGAPQLLAFGQMWLPQLAQMNIEPDGQPRELPLPIPQAAEGGTWVALTDTSLAMAVGPSAETSLPGLLQSESAMPPPFMSIDLDAARYYEMIAASIGASDQSDEPESAEVQAATSDLLTAVAELYDRIGVDVAFTARGVEVRSVVTLAE